MRERHEFRSGKTAMIDSDLCKGCRECIWVCRFEAISDDFKVDPVSCEGCSLCSHICPVSAIRMVEKVCNLEYENNSHI